MDQPYSFWADWLNKFHTSSDGIQALWLIVPAVTILGVAYLAAQVLHAALRSRAGGTPQAANHQLALPEGYLLYGIYRNAEGQLMLYRHGISRGLDPEDLPPQLGPTGR